MTIVMNNRTISEKIYLITLFIWVVVTSLVTTTYFIRLEGSLSLYRIVLYFTIAMILIKELVNLPRSLYHFRFHWEQLLIAVLFIISMFIVAKNREGLLDLNVLLLVFSARDIDFRKLLGTFSFATFLVLVLTILSILILTYALFSLKIIKKDFIIGHFWMKTIAKYGFILALIITLYFCFYSSGNLFHFVDQFTHNRLRLSVEGFRNFGVSWLGQHIKFTLLDIFGNFTSNYNFIDSSFVQLLVIDGLIVSAFMLLTLTKVMKYFVTIRKDIVLACLGVMIIHGMFDPQMLVLRYSPLILFISRLFIMNSDNEIE